MKILDKSYPHESYDIEVVLKAADSSATDEYTIILLRRAIELLQDEDSRMGGWAASGLK